MRAARSALDQLTDPFDARAPLPGRRELALAAIAIAAAALALYVRHVVRGGWYYDDWALFGYADLASGGAFASVEALLDVGYRPGFSLGLALLHALGGTDPTVYLAAGLALIAVQCLLFFWVLRAVGLRTVPSAVAAALLLALPAIDTTRLWATAFPIWMALCLYLVGVGAAMLGLRSSTPRARIAWHAVAVLGYAAATLTYELVVPLVLITALLYLPRGGPRAAAPRWGADILSVAIPLAWVLSRAEDDRPIELTPGYVADRVSDVIDSAWTVFLNLLPADQLLRGPVGVVLALLVAVGLGAAVATRAPLTGAVRTWAAIGGTALLFALAGLLPLIPAEPYYILRWTGISNRFGAVSSMGVVLLMLALAVLAAVAIATLARRPRWAGALAAVVLAVTLAQWGLHEVRNQDAWAESWDQAETVLAAVRETVPADPPSGSTVITFNHARIVLPDDIPIFADSWDLNGAIRLAFRDSTLIGQPAGPALACRADGVRLPREPNALAADTGVQGTAAPYGKLWFVDVGDRRAYRIASQAACERRLAAFVPA